MKEKVTKKHFEIGQKLKENAQFKAALANFEQALEYSKDAHIYLEMIDCYVELFQLSHAVKLAQKACELFNDEYKVFYALADTYIKAEKYDTAKEFINHKLMPKFPGREENYCILGVCLAKLGKYDEANSRVSKCLELNPQNIDGQVVLGKIFYAQDKLKKAKEVFMKVLHQDLKNSQAHLYLGMIYSLEGQNENAVSEFKYIVDKINPRDIEAYFNLGLTYSIMGWSQEAIASYMEVLKLRPQHVETRYAIAYVHYQNKDYESALKQVNAGLGNSNHNSDLYWLKGEILFQQNNYKDSLFNYEQALRVNPEDAKIHSCLAKAYYGLGLKDLAVEYYLMAISKEPTNNDNYLKVARIYEEQKAYDLAIKYYNMTVERNKNLINGYIGLGYCHKQMKDYDKALGFFNHVSSMNENVPEIHFQIADINKLKEEFDGAVEHYTESLNLKPNNPKAYFEIGNIYKQKDDFDNAKLYYQEALSIDPQDSKVHAALGEIFLFEKKYKESELKLKTALRFDSQNDKALAVILKCYKAQNKYKQAHKVLQRFMKNTESEEKLTVLKEELKEIRKFTQGPIQKVFAKIFG